MDKQKTIEELKIIYKSLPKIIQDSIMKSGWENTIRKLVSKYDLRVDQGTQLENMTFALMMGQLSAEEYYQTIIDELELGPDGSRALFDDIDHEVFEKTKGIILQLEKEQEINEKNLELESDKILNNIEKKEQENDSLENSRNTERFNYVRDDVETASAEDEILTLTRDEILRGIEDPEDIVMENQDLPDLKSTNTMASQNKPEEAQSGILNSNFGKVDSYKAETNNDEVYNAPKSPVVNETINENPKPVDPVEAGLNNQVSSSIKNYKDNDPYREPIE